MHLDSKVAESVSQVDGLLNTCPCSDALAPKRGCLHC